jgi:hypothetical protein
MKAIDILHEINQLPKPQADEIALVRIDDLDRYFFGKNASNDIVLVIKSNSDKAKRLSQKTQDLRLDTNASHSFVMDGKSIVLRVHVFTCTAQDAVKRLAFIRLFYAFVQEDDCINETEIVTLFTALLSLFAGRQKCPSNEIQGLFAELYTMVYFESKGIDLYQYWKSEDRRTDDF